MAFQRAASLVLCVQMTMLVAVLATYQGTIPGMPQSTVEYSDAEWLKVLQSVAPRADSPRPRPFLQPVGAGILGRAITPQIVGGIDAFPGQFPWQVLIHIDGNKLCGGSLILANWILTAAHCIGTDHTLYFGTISQTSLTTGYNMVMSNKTFVHQGYNRSNLNNDIALIQLMNEIPLTDNIKLVKLPPPTDATSTFEGVVATVSGFGKTSDADPPSTSLRHVNLTVISNGQCALIYGSSVIRHFTICANQTEKSTCPGDSGGPLVYKDSANAWVQIGVVSFGAASGCLNGPSGFVRTASYLDWMVSIIGALPAQPPNNSSMPPPNNSSMPPPNNSSMPPPNNSSLPPPNNSSMSPPNNSSLSPPNNSSMPPPNNSSLPPPNNSSMPPPNNSSMSPPDNSSMPPPNNSSLPPPNNSSMPPPNNSSIPPPNNSSLPPPNNSSMPPPNNSSLPPPNNSSTPSTGNVTTNATTTTISSTKGTTTKATTAKKTTTKKTTTTKPPKCEKYNFASMAKCCETNIPSLVLPAKNNNDKLCKVNAGALKFFNEYHLNKQQSPDLENAFDFTNKKNIKALAKEAKFVNCYLGQKEVVVEDEIDLDRLLEILIANQEDEEVMNKIADSVGECYNKVVSSFEEIPMFSDGKTEHNGGASILIQCIQFNLIRTCDARKNSTKDSKCIKDYGAFDYCQKNIFTEVLEEEKLRAKLNKKVTNKKRAFRAKKGYSGKPKKMSSKKQAKTVKNTQKAAVKTVKKVVKKN